MRCRFLLRTLCRFSEPIEGHVFCLRALPLAMPGQELQEGTLATWPESSAMASAPDVWGNTTWSGRIDAPHGDFEVRVQGVVRTDVPTLATPPAAYCRYPTRLTRPGDAIEALWRSVQTACGASPERTAMALMHAVHEAFSYRPGTTGTHTTGEQALAKGEGVCQDYAHVLIALLRKAGMPALYVAGLVQGTGATHAWVQAWTGSKWLALDPTHNCLAQGAYVMLARGCDFEEAALERGIFLGRALQNMHTTAVVQPID